MFADLLHKAGLHMERNLPLVIYRKPGETGVTAIFQNDKRLNSVGDLTGSGFVFFPFDNDKEGILLRPDELLAAEFGTTPIPGEEIPDLKLFGEEGKDDHIDLVKRGITMIKNGTLKKVVLSRNLNLEYSGSPLQLFLEMLNHYPTAFCYLWYHPDVGIWAGATPETLISVRNGEFQTMSLAGTRAYTEGIDPVWGKKEIQEQGWVTDYMLSTLKHHVDKLEISELQTVRAGNLWHLRNEIKGHISEEGLRTLIGSLHPTPAVCGLPKGAAKDFILKNEGYDRRFYTGFLGELNIGGPKQMHLFVNLRCLQLKEEKAIVYVGGGITMDSDPEKEWEETVNKSATMLKILFKSR